jgi:hypothetical protein
MMELSAHVANTTASNFLNVRAIIIDQISKLGAKKLYKQDLQNK